MGMFDSLYIECQCGERLEFQSKRGPCQCNEYTLGDCPSAVAGDLMGESQRCKCGRVATLRGAVVLVPEWRGP